MINYCVGCGGRIAVLEEGCPNCAGAPAGEAVTGPAVDTPERLAEEISRAMAAEAIAPRRPAPAPAQRAATVATVGAVGTAPAKPAPPPVSTFPEEILDIGGPSAPVVATAEEVRSAPVVPPGATRPEAPEASAPATLTGAREASLAEAGAALSAVEAAQGPAPDEVRIGRPDLRLSSEWERPEMVPPPSEVSGRREEAHPPAVDPAGVISTARPAAPVARAWQDRVFSLAPLAGLAALVVLGASTLLAWFAVQADGGSRVVVGLAREDGKAILAFTLLAAAAAAGGWLRPARRPLFWLLAGGWGTFALCYFGAFINRLVSAGGVRAAGGLYVGAAAAAVAASGFALAALRSSQVAGGGAGGRRGQAVLAAHAAALLAGVLLPGQTPAALAPAAGQPPRPLPTAEAAASPAPRREPVVLPEGAGETLNSAPVVVDNSQGPAAESRQARQEQAADPLPAAPAAEPPVAVPDLSEIPVARARLGAAGRKRQAATPAPQPRGGSSTKAGKSATPAPAPPAPAPAANPNTWRPSRRPPASPQ